MTSLLDGCTPWPAEFVDRYRAAGLWRGDTLDDLLRDRSLRYGPRTALVHGGTRLTYARLNRSVDRMAAGFRLRGLRPGQRVVVQLPNVPEFVITVFALMRAGAVPVLCPMTHRAAEVSHVVRVGQAVGYVGPRAHQGFDLTAMAADIAAQGPFLRRVFTFEAPGESSPYGGFTVDPAGCQYYPLGSLDSPPDRPLAQSADQVAFFLLSGVAGAEPALVPRTHDAYAYQVRAAAELVSLTEDDVYLVALPAASDFAFGCPGIVGTLSVGGTVVMAEDAGAAACLAAVERERVTVTFLEPGDARLWLDLLPSAQADVSSLRLAQIGGVGSLERATAARVGPVLGCGLQQVFGTAEGCSPSPGQLIRTRPSSARGGARSRPTSRSAWSTPTARTCRRGCPASSSPVVPTSRGATTGRPIAPRAPSPPTATSAPAPSYGAPRPATWW